jgi:hypothetical protein
MKVIGRDLWIGVWAFTFAFLSIGLTTKVSRWRSRPRSPAYRR